MAVINLGQFGPPRRSKLAGLADYTQELAKTKVLEGMEQQAEAGRERRSVRTAETTRMGQEASLQVALAQTKSKRETEERAFMTKQLTHIADAPDQKRQEFIANKEAYTGFKKAAKRIMGPDIFDPKGEIIWEGFTTQNQLMNQITQKTMDLQDKAAKGTITEKGLEELQMLKSGGADAIARRIINVQGYKTDLATAIQDINKGENPENVFRQMVGLYPKQSEELKRIFFPPSTARDLKVTGSDVKEAKAQVSKWAEFLGGPGYQTPEGIIYDKLRKKQVSQFF